MNISFYNGAVGANTHQNRLDILANNIANVQTEGYKAQSAVFQDMLYSNMSAQPPDNGDLTVGSSARVEKTNIDFREGGMIDTGRKLDYTIVGDGYFALYDMGKDEVRYSRNGNFFMSQVGQGNSFYLCAKDGSFVLDENMAMIPIESYDDQPNIGVFDFANKEGILLQGDNSFLPVEKNGDPIRQDEPTLKQGTLEMSNVDLSYEMANLIETQRAYQLSLRMVSTSDEIEQTINSLR